MITDSQWRDLLHTRATDPSAVAHAYTDRRKRDGLLSARGTLFLVAADHPARGALGVGGDPMAMADRRSLLERLLTALANPEVDGVLGTPDVVEELLLLDALHGKVVIGSMNRGGLAGAAWEIDDRFTAYTAESLAKRGLDGGKMLLRIVNSDAGTASTLESCARAVSELAERGLVAMVEPLPYLRDDNGKLLLDVSTPGMARAVCVASGLGVTSSRTWLKLPAVQTRVLASTTLPVLVLGGEPTGAPGAAIASWRRTLAHPVVRGLVVGRSLLYPPDDDVAGAVAAAAAAVREAT